MCVYVFQCVFVCGCQKASNKKLLDHNFSSPLTMPKNMQQQSTGGATSLSGRITLMSLSLHTSVLLF